MLWRLVRMRNNVRQNQCPRPHEEWASTISSSRNAHRRLLNNLQAECRTEGFSNMMSIRERINSVLPATVTSFELVSDTVPVMHAGVMGFQIWGVFVGQSAGEALWDEMNPPDLAVRLKAFEKNDLLTMDGGPGWLHLDFTNGWIRIVADTWEWEPWLIIFPDIWWTEDI